jgi:hypothetical protein
MPWTFPAVTSGAAGGKVTDAISIWFATAAVSAAAAPWLHLHARQRRQQLLDHQMWDRARSGRAVIERARARQRDQLIERASLHIGRRDDDDRLWCHARDRVQVALDDETRFRVHQRADHHRVGIDQHGVAVRLRGGDLLAGNTTRGTTAVFDHDRLLQQNRHLVGEHAGDRINTAARRKADDQAHGVRGIRFLLRRSRSEPDKHGTKTEDHDRCSVQQSGKQPAGAVAAMTLQSFGEVGHGRLSLLRRRQSPRNIYRGHSEFGYQELYLTASLDSFCMINILRSRHGFNAGAIRARHEPNPIGTNPSRWARP